jgi:hypothetical protein
MAVRQDDALGNLAAGLIQNLLHHRFGEIGQAGVHHRPAIVAPNQPDADVETASQEVEIKFIDVRRDLSESGVRHFFSKE